MNTEVQALRFCVLVIDEPPMVTSKDAQFGRSEDGQLLLTAMAIVPSCFIIASDSVDDIRQAIAFCQRNSSWLRIVWLSEPPTKDKGPDLH